MRRAVRPKAWLEKIQRVYSASGLVGRFALADPVDGGEDDEGLGGVEVDPEQAARGTEVEDAAGGGDVAVVVGDDLAGDGEVVVCGVGEGLRLGRAPEGLGGGEVLVEEGKEARVADEVALAAFGGRRAVLPEPFGAGAIFVFCRA